MLYIDLPLFMASTFSISSFYLVSQKELFPGKWYRALLYLPFLMALGIGLTITNTRAVLEALRGKHPVIAPLLEYRAIQASVPPLASRDLYDRIARGDIKGPTIRVRARLKRGPTPE